MTSARGSPLVALVVTLLIPALILMNLSGPGALGPVGSLLLALTFPIVWGALDLRRGINLFAVLGIVAVSFTGGIGLLALDPRWVAVREAAVPGVLGLVVAGSALTRLPLVRMLLYTRAVFDVERIEAALAAQGNTSKFDSRLRTATWMLAGSFVFSAAMNYLLAVSIVTSPAGTTAFNQELGRLALLSFPVIAVPATLMVVAVMLYLATGLHRLAGIGVGEAFRS